MRTALDTNVLSALWSSEPGAANIAAQLDRARVDGAVLISAPVYAELLAHPKISEAALADFLSETGISIDFELTPPVWLEAGRRYAKYAVRRRNSKNQDAKRLLADFIIGSHALIRADRFLTLDAKRYERDFPELKLA
jgi:predicted nucleic acid-binding protein